MHGLYLLAKCCFCPGSFIVESESYEGTLMYQVENTLFCPHCHTRIIGIRGDRKGRELEVIPTSEEMAEWFETQKQ